MKESRSLRMLKTKSASTDWNEWLCAQTMSCTCTAQKIGGEIVVD